MAEQPEEAVADLPEGAQTVPEEMTQELQQKERAAWEKVLDKTASDANFRQRFLDDPQAALEELGVSEDIDAHMSETAEVAGQSAYYSYYYGPHRHYYRHYNTYRWQWHYHHYV
ncbi:MAG: hypothetical protein ABR600_11725 [Actinomycetota bacterium]